MRAIVKPAIIGILATLLLGTVFASRATAQCGYSDWLQAASVSTQSSNRDVEATAPLFAPPADKDGSDGRIVGFWKVKFVSEGTSGIPDGTVIDNGFVQWHADRTEIMNSSRVPATGNFCLGVWDKSGPSRYELNHFALAFDPAGNFVGPAQIRERVTLDKKADRYEGSFTIDQYDSTGKPMAHIGGQVTGARILVDTPVADVF